MNMNPKPCLFLSRKMSLTVSYSFLNSKMKVIGRVYLGATGRIQDKSRRECPKYTMVQEL